MRGTDRNLAIPLNICQTTMLTSCAHENETPRSNYTLFDSVALFPYFLPNACPFYLKKKKKKITNTYSMSSLQVYTRTE